MFRCIQMYPDISQKQEKEKTLIISRYIQIYLRYIQIYLLMNFFLWYRPFIFKNKRYRPFIFKNKRYRDRLFMDTVYF